MLYVTQKYSRGSRRKPAKVIGHHAILRTYSPSDFSKSQVKHNWASVTAYNWACLHEEGGGRASSATRRAFLRSFRRIWTIERLLGRNE